MKHSICAAALAVLLAACEITGIDDAGPGVVAGIDLDPLFAAATADEIAAVVADWSSRDVSVRDYRQILVEERELAGRAMRVEIVSHFVAGQTHYGAVVVPAGASARSLPVMMYLHGGDGGVSVDGEVGFVLQFFADLRDDFVVVVPSFRDEPLRYGDERWQSEGPASPWNYDVDDALALLNVALETVPEADADRVAAFGMSRGAAVGMLMSARDPRVDRVVEFFGPTDFFGDFVQEVTIEALEGRPRDLPGLDFMNEHFLIPLREGQLQAVDLRPEIVRRSAVLFVDRMPLVQAHHGDADTVVPVSQARSLIRAMESAGKAAPEFEGFIYAGGEHNPISLPFGFDRAVEFLRPLLR